MDHNLFLPTLLDFYEGSCTTTIDKPTIEAHWMFLRNGFLIVNDSKPTEFMEFDSSVNNGKGVKYSNGEFNLEIFHYLSHNHDLMAKLKHGETEIDATLLSNKYPENDQIFRTCEFEKNFQYTINTFMESCNKIKNTNVAQRSTTQNNPMSHNKLVEKQTFEDYHIFLPTLLQFYKNNSAKGVDKLRIAAHWVFLKNGFLIMKDAKKTEFMDYELSVANERVLNYFNGAFDLEAYHYISNAGDLMTRFQHQGCKFIVISLRKKYLEDNEISNAGQFEADFQRKIKYFMYDYCTKMVRTDDAHQQIQQHATPQANQLHQDASVNKNQK